MLENIFKLKEHGTTAKTEIMAGMTTFFAMSYILFVNPMVLSLSGMPIQAVFLATIIASVVGTLVMGLYANVPYAQAPGMGLNAFFTYSVVLGLGYTWQEGLAMVFLCGLINIFITVTRIRKKIIHAIPISLQNAIGGGIGIFIAYIGLKNAGFILFTSDQKAIHSVITDEQGAVSTVISNGGIIPSLTNFTQPQVLVALFGLILTIVFMLWQVKGAMFLGILLTTLLAAILGILPDTSQASSYSLSGAWHELSMTFGAALGKEGMLSLFQDVSKIPQVLLTVLAFSLSDIFDTIGTFIGTGRSSGIFDQAEEDQLFNQKGIRSKMDKALFSDAIATTTGALIGTSNVTTYVESTAGIGAGGRTGLTSVTVAVLFLLSSFLAPVIALVPQEATAAALIVVGIMMLASFTNIHWDQLDEAIPAFFSSVFMGLCYSIAYGIATGFIFYVIVKVAQGKRKEIGMTLWCITALFIINFILQAWI